MGSDPSKAKIEYFVYYTHHLEQSGNDKILRKTYKDTKKKLIEKMKVNKTISDNQKEEN